MRIDQHYISHSGNVPLMLVKMHLPLNSVSGDTAKNNMSKPEELETQTNLTFFDKYKRNPVKSGD